ncbi:MAG: T9SS type A sorting domain-containing protein, partial [Bacteroidota bacterium]|nr:T9SS type A sorting domain-containing protein [Bacteroidota bacterium]
TSNLLVINVTNDANTFSDKNKVGIRQDASMDYDLEFDSHKLFGWETAPQLWTAMGSEIFSTNYLSPLQTSYSLPLNFHAGVNSTYHLNFDGISSFDANIEIVLEDVISNTLVELSTQNNYSFTATTNDISERFILQFNLINENNELVQEESIRILYYDNSVSIINTTGNEGRVSIFDLSGKEIFSNNLTGEKLNSFSVNLSSGVYLIKANAGTELNTTKIFIH